MSMDAALKESIFNFAQSVSPRKIRRSEISFDAFIKAAKKEIQSKPASVRLQSLTSSYDTYGLTGGGGSYSRNNSFTQLNRLGMEDEEGSTLSGDDSEVSSLVSADDDSSFRSGSGYGRMKHASSTSSIPSQLASKAKTQANRIKRLQELRETRRKANYTEQYTAFDCNEDMLVETYLPWYECLLDSGELPVKMYQMIMNTLQYYFNSRCQSEAEVELRLGEFARDHVQKNCAELERRYEENTRWSHHRRLLETQLQIFVEFHLMISPIENPPALEQTEIVKKMQYLYIAGDAALMRKFLEEYVTDTFVNLIPRDILSLYDQLCMNLPIDLEELDEARADRSFEDVFSEANGGNSSMLNRLLEDSLLLEQSETDGKEKIKKDKVDKEVNERKRRSDDAIMRTPRSARKRKAVDHTKNGFVPETPEEKLRRREKTVDEESLVKDIVKETPMGKLRAAANKKGSKRLSELVKLSEERVRPSRAAALLSEKASRAMIQSIAPSTSRESLLSLNTPSPRPQRARSNLMNRIALMNETLAAPVSKNTRRSNEAPKKVERELRERKPPPQQPKSTPSSSTTSSPIKGNTMKNGKKETVINVKNEEEEDNDPFGMGKEQMAQYRKRMQAIIKKKDMDENEIFYGRVAHRSSLFAETSSPKEQVNYQKNRSGRLIRGQEILHYAHSLLNVHNPRPLEPWKVAKYVVASSPPKLHKLIRAAGSKSARRKLKKMRVRFQKASSPTNSQNSGSGSNTGSADS